MRAAVLHNELVAHDASAQCACIGPISGLLLATGGDDNALHVWRLGSPAAIATSRDFKRPVTALAFGPAEGHLAVGTEGGVVKVVSFDSQKVRAIFSTAHSARVTALAWHPAGERYLASGGADCRVHLLDAGANSVVNTYTMEKAQRSTTPARGAPPAAPPALITCLVFSPPGSWLAVGDASGRVIVWDLKDGRALAVWEGAASGGTAHRGAVTALAWHPTELLLASGGADKTVRFWSLEQQGTSHAGGLIAATPVDAGAVRSILFRVPADSSAAAVHLLSVTEVGVRTWALPAAGMPPRSVDVLDIDWKGSVAASWIGHNARICVSGGVEQQLVVVVLDGPVMRAFALPENGAAAATNGASSESGLAASAPRRATAVVPEPAPLPQITHNADNAISTRGDAAALGRRDVQADADRKQADDDRSRVTAAAARAPLSPPVSTAPPVLLPPTHPSIMSALSSAMAQIATVQRQVSSLAPKEPAPQPAMPTPASAAPPPPPFSAAGGPSDEEISAALYSDDGSRPPALPLMRSPGDIKLVGGLLPSESPRAPGDFVPSRRDAPVGLSAAAFVPDNAATGFGVSRRAPLAATGLFNTRGANIEKHVLPSRARARGGDGARAHSDLVCTLKERASCIRDLRNLWSAGNAREALAAVLNGEEHARVNVLCALIGLDFVEEAGTGLSGGAPATPRLRAIPPVSSGGGTGVFESLGLGLEAGAGIVSLALVTIDALAEAEEGGGRAALVSKGVVGALAGFHAAATILRSFAPVLRATWAAVGAGGVPLSGVGGISSPPVASVDVGALLATAASRTALDPALEDRAARSAAVLSGLSHIRTRAASRLGVGFPAQPSSSTVATLAPALVASARAFSILYDQCIAALG